METERWKERLNRRQMKRFHWAFRPIQNSTYDPERGWKLDQFAMNCEPDLVVAHRLHLKERDAQAHDAFDLISIDDSDLNMKVRARLLGPKYVVKAIPVGLHHPEVIPVILLEILHVFIETSELVEVGDPVDGRHYEHVRIFEPVGQDVLHARLPAEAGERSVRVRESDRETDARPSRTGGRPRTYDWEALFKKMDAINVPFSNKAELKRSMCKEVDPMPGKRLPKHGPSDKTVDDAILMYPFEKFIRHC